MAHTKPADGLAKLVKNSADDVADIPASRDAFEKVMSGGLPPNKQDNFFKKIKNWDNASGELSNAAHGARKWLENETELGATKLSEATEALFGAQAGEEYMAVIGRHYANNPLGPNVNRIKDSLTALTTPMTASGAGPDVIAYLGNPALGRKFQAFRYLDPQDLTQQQIDWIKGIRNAIPGPENGDMMRKVIRGDTFFEFIENPQKKISGFCTQEVYVSDLHTLDEMKNALRLDYSGGLTNDVEAAVMRFPIPDSQTVGIPYSPRLGGSVSEPYPFTGNGFAASLDGGVRPESIIAVGGIDVPNGTIMDAIAADGNTLFRYEFNGTVWVEVTGP